MDHEKATAASENMAAVKKARRYAVMSGLDPEPPLAEATPMSTVDNTATPVALPT